METQRLRIATALAIIALLMSSSFGFSASSNSCYNQIASCAKGCMSAITVKVFLVDAVRNGAHALTGAAPS
jgi:hypothetical protein